MAKHYSFKCIDLDYVLNKSFTIHAPYGVLTKTLKEIFSENCPFVSRMPNVILIKD